MAVKMIRQAVGMANHLGSQTRTYEAGEELSANEDWEKPETQIWSVGLLKKLK